MQSLFVPALLIPRSAPRDGASLLGKAPSGFGSMLQELSASAMTGPTASALIQELVVMQDRDGTPLPKPQPAPQAAAEADDEQETTKSPVQTPAELPALVPVVLLDVPAPAAAVAQPVEEGDALPARPVPPGPVQGQTPAGVAMPPSVMTALPAVTKQQAPPPAEQVPDGRPTVTAETQKMPESRPATAEAPQMPARAEARATTTQGIDLALLEEAGMDILRATGEVDKPIVRRPSAAMPDQLQGATKSPPDALPSSPVARARTDEATGAAVQQHESHGRRHAPSAASANTEAAESADQRRPAQVFRESLRDALPDLVETSRLQSARSTPLAERHTEADPGQSPPSERAATSAPHDVDRPSSVQDAPSGAGRRGAEELRPDVSGAGRTLQHEMPRALGAARPESRAPELARTLVDQVVKALQLEIKGPVSEMRLHLEPESLGELALRVRVDEGKLQARIEVTQPAVKAIIEGNLPQLRQSLAAQGIQMDRIDIATQDRSLSRGNSEGSGGRERRRGSKPDESLVEPAVQAARMLGYNTIELTM